MEDIKTQTGYNFLCVKSHLKDVKPVTFSVVNASLQEVMELLCKEQPVTFEIKDRVIILKNVLPPGFRFMLFRR
ncbi:DUF4974 domain-containing protein [Niabella sp. W65]|nr:DUF4974 domain-containing protein [Niabella sp. W65]MCH7362896.1 DUF4974 domain-containing protein [Niabella sp. W65]